MAMVMENYSRVIHGSNKIISGSFNHELIALFAVDKSYDSSVAYALVRYLFIYHSTAACSSLLPLGMGTITTLRVIGDLYTWWNFMVLQHYSG